MTQRMTLALIASSAGIMRDPPGKLPLRSLRHKQDRFRMVSMPDFWTKVDSSFFRHHGPSQSETGHRMKSTESFPRVRRMGMQVTPGAENLAKISSVGNSFAPFMVPCLWNTLLTGLSWRLMMSWPHLPNGPMDGFPLWKKFGVSTIMSI